MGKLTWTYKGMKSDLFVEREDFVIGRQVGGAGPPVSLDLDMQIAPQHARVWKANGAWWVEDLGTPGGTFVDDVRVVGPRVFPIGGTLRLGASQLAWQEGGPVGPVRARPGIDSGTPPDTDNTATLGPNVLRQSDGSNVHIVLTMKARQDAPLFFDTSRGDSQGRIAQLLV